MCGMLGNYNTNLVLVLKNNNMIKVTKTVEQKPFNEAPKAKQAKMHRFLCGDNSLGSVWRGG
jgi:hypothetical protein